MAEVSLLRAVESIAHRAGGGCWLARRRRRRLQHGNESRLSEVRYPYHEHRGARCPSGFDAMESAHRLGIVRRDLKPENVMVLTEPGARVA